MSPCKWVPSVRFSQIHRRLLKGGAKQYRSRLGTLAENVQQEREKELGKSFKEILVDTLNQEEQQQDEEEEGAEEEPIEDQEYPGKVPEPRGERQVEGVGQELDSDELVKEYRDLGEDEESRANREANEEEAMRKKAIAKAKQAKKDLAAKRKRLGVTSVEDEYEDALGEAEDINDAIDEELDYDPDEGPLPLTKDNILDTIGAIDPRLGVAVAGIRGIEAAINKSGNPIDKMKALGSTLGYGAVNAALGAVGLSMTPAEWEDATNKMNHGLEYAFAPGTAAAKDAKYAQEAAQRATESQVLASQQRNTYKTFEKQAEVSDAESKAFETLVDAVDGGYATAAQKAQYDDTMNSWDTITNAPRDQAKMAYRQYALRQKNVYTPNPPPSTAVSKSTIRQVRTDTALNQNLVPILQVTDNRAPCSAYPVPKGLCREGDFNLPPGATRSQEQEPLGFLTMTPDGRATYLTPFANPMTGEFPWNVIYSELDGIDAPFEPWFWFVVGKNNTEAQKRAYLMKQLSIKTSPAFTTWMREWNLRAQMSPLPIDNNDTPTFSWRWTLPPNYPILSFQQQYEAFITALATWESIANEQLNMLRRLLQFDFLASLGLAQTNVTNASPDYDKIVREISYKDRNNYIGDDFQVRDDDQFINPQQYWLGKLALIMGDVVPLPPAPTGLVKSIVPIQAGVYTDPETGIQLDAYDAQGNPIPNDVLKAQIKTLQDEEAERLKGESDIKKAEAEAKALVEESRVKTEGLTQEYNTKIEKQQAAILASPSSRANLEFIQKVSKDYNSAEGFAKRHWFDIEAVKSGGNVFFFTKEDWEGTGVNSADMAPRGENFKTFINSVLFEYYAAQKDKWDATSPKAVPAKQAAYEAATQAASDDGFIKALSDWYSTAFPGAKPPTPQTNSSTGNIDREATVKEYTLVKDLNGQGKGPLEYWGLKNFAPYGFDYTKLTYPPTPDNLPKEFIDNYNTFMKKRVEQFPQLAKPAKTMLVNGKINNIPYKTEELQYKDLPDVQKANFEVPDNTPMIKLTPGSSGVKMEDTEVYKALLEAWPKRDLFLRRFDATEWGVDDSVTEEMLVLYREDVAELKTQIVKRPGYYIPLLTIDELIKYLTEQKTINNYRFTSDPVVEYITNYLTLRTLVDKSIVEPIKALGNIQIDVAKLEETPNPQIASEQEVNSRLPFIQYPVATNIVLTTEVKTPLTGSGYARGKRLPRFMKNRQLMDLRRGGGRGCFHTGRNRAIEESESESSSSSEEEDDEYNPPSVPSELLFLTTPSKGRSRPGSKKRVSAEHLAKLQAGRRKYQTVKMREQRLY